MLMTTVNISLPKSMYEDARKALSARGYASISEFVRDAMRGILYPQLTENGFAPEFEQKVLEAAKEPEDNDIELRTDKEVKDYFLHLKVPKRYKSNNDKGKVVRKVSGFVSSPR